MLNKGNILFYVNEKFYFYVNERFYFSDKYGITKKNSFSSKLLDKRNIYIYIYIKN